MAAGSAGFSRASEIAAADLDSLPAAQVVILGEVHDNPAHHLNQARALRALAPAAVAFEMLTPDQAVLVNRRDPSGTALADALAWADTGWPPFDIYAPVFDAVGSAEVFGMAVPRDTVRRAVSEGAAVPFAAAFGGGAERFGLDAPLPASEQELREAHQLAAHCDALPAAMVPGMVAAQRLRDAAFAWTILQALDATGGPVAVIAGNGHARRDWGIPAALARAAPDVSVLSLGQIEGGMTRAAGATPPFDVWLATAAVERPDPCADFAVAPEPASDAAEPGTDG